MAIVRVLSSVETLPAQNRGSGIKKYSLYYRLWLCKEDK